MHVVLCCHSKRTKMSTTAQLVDEVTEAYHRLSDALQASQISPEARLDAVVKIVCHMQTTTQFSAPISQPNKRASEGITAPSTVDSEPIKPKRVIPKIPPVELIKPKPMKFRPLGPSIKPIGSHLAFSSDGHKPSSLKLLSTDTSKLRMRKINHILHPAPFLDEQPSLYDERPIRECDNCGGEDCNNMLDGCVNQDPDDFCSWE